jgi:glycosidase
MKVYQIFVDRFSTGNPAVDKKLAYKTSKNRLGGNLRGIINKLDYIKSLGFDAIWLTPIFSAMDYHGYSTLDFYSVDKHFGSNETLKELVNKAHAIGLKVILDFVANHVSNKHKFFISALNDKSSVYRNWFVFGRNNSYMSFLDVKELPKLNTKNRDVVNYLIDAALYWIRDFGIDGYRLDHAIGPTLEFWKEFTAACLKLNKNFVFLPEIWLSGIDPAYSDTLWFMQDEETRLKFIPIFKKNKGLSWDKIPSADGEELADLMFKGIFDTPLDFSANKAIRSGRYTNNRNNNGFVFADNHDMQRISWILNGDKSAIDSAVKSVWQANNSIVYYGTEIYLSQLNDFAKFKSFSDKECRRFMDWSKATRENVDRFRKLFLQV